MPTLSPAPANVRVIVRVRPLNSTELISNGPLGKASVLSVENKSIIVSTQEWNTNQMDFIDANSGNSILGTNKHYTFDAVHGPRSSQSEVFDSIQEIVEAVSSGYNGTIVAYGQTGSGKTFTVFGSEDGDGQGLGLVQRSLRTLFSKMTLMQARAATYDNSTSGVSEEETDKMGSITAEFRASFFEIFNDRVYDLLSPSDSLEVALPVREDAHGVYVDGLKEIVVKNTEDAENVLRKGMVNRHVASTNMNRTSSRSHAVFILNVRSEHTSSDGLQKIRNSKFALVDLAGSERQKKTAVVGERLKEASMINKSLLCLGHVINALVDRESGRDRHVPFRDSKLTFLLRDSWGGNSKTCLVATVSPSSASLCETLSTLNFAHRAKLIKNTAILNEDTCGTVAALQAEVSRLRSQLQKSLISHGASTETIAAAEVTKGSGELLSVMIRRIKRAERKAAYLEKQISDKNEILNTLKRKLDDAYMVRKFKDRRIEYLQQKHEDINNQDQISLLQSEIKSLREQLEKPSADAITWKVAYEKLKEDFEEKFSNSVDDNESLDAEISKLDEALWELTKEKESLSQTINDMTQNSLETQEEIESILQEVNRLENEMLHLQEALKQKEQELTAALSRVFEAESQKAHLISVQEESNFKAQEMSKIIAVAQEKIRLMETDILATKVAANKAQTEALELQAQLASIQKEKENLKIEFDSAICSLQADLREKDIVIVEARLRNEKTDANLRALMADMAEQHKVHLEATNRVEQDIVQLKALINEKEHELKVERQHCAEAESIASFLRIDKVAYEDRNKTKLEEAHKQITALEYSLDEKEKVVTGFEIRALTAEEKNAELQDSLTGASKKILLLESQLLDLELNYSALDKKSLKLQSSEESSVKRVHLLEDRIVLLKRENGCISFQLDALREDHDALMDQMRCLGDRIRHLEKENDTLKRDRRCSENISSSISCMSNTSTFQCSESFEELSAKMNVILKRMSSNSPQQGTPVQKEDESFDESLFLPNIAVDDQNPCKKENHDSVDNEKTISLNTPLKPYYGTKRQPLTELKQQNTTPFVLPSEKESKSSCKTKFAVANGNKHRSNWMIFDNAKIFDRS